MNQGNTIIWVHGWGTNSSVWRELIDRLPTYNHIFPSFKSAKKPEGFLTCVVKCLPPGKGTIIGWSMGAMLAVEAAARHPARITRLICFNTSFRFTDRDRQLGWPRISISKMKKSLTIDPRDTLQTFVNLLILKGKQTSERIRQFEKLFLDINSTDGDSLGSEIPTMVPRKETISVENCDFTVDGLAAGLDYLTTVDLLNEIESLDQPVLWIHGEKDSICPVGRFSELMDLHISRQNHQFKVLRNTGHVSFFEKPEETLKIVEKFLQETHETDH